MRRSEPRIFGWGLICTSLGAEKCKPRHLQEMREWLRYRDEYKIACFHLDEVPSLRENNFYIGIVLVVNESISFHKSVLWMCLKTLSFLGLPEGRRKGRG